MDRSSRVGWLVLLAGAFSVRLSAAATESSLMLGLVFMQCQCQCTHTDDGKWVTLTEFRSGDWRNGCLRHMFFLVQAESTEYSVG